MILSNSQTTYASLHCSGQWLHAKLLSALFKMSNVKPMKGIALISRFYWLSYGSLDLRWNGFLAIGTMNGLHWKLKSFFFVFHLVQQISKSSLPIAMTTEFSTSGQIRHQNVSMQVMGIHAAEQISCWEEVQSILIFFPIQCHNVAPTYRDKASVFSQAQIPVKWQSTCFIAKYSTYTSKNPQKSEFKGLFLLAAWSSYLT